MSEIEQNVVTEPNPAQPPASTKPTSSPVVRIVSLLGMVVGLAIVISGMLIGGNFSGVARISPDVARANTTSVRELRFGADFYTEIHRATATAANNVGNLTDVAVIGANNVGSLVELVNSIDSNNASHLESLTAVIRLIPIAIGLFIFLYFLLQLVKPVKFRAA